ncbi:hypothetical protein G5714_021696 [Onychostoma macrolepis]|uniref:Uncharacterized protein n=1 Tax=Onychostoma macrolepis TaxID=369639 RepID=A0A7J6BRT2_9TELE|nr:hypothetical protein G5714_021696 [Onychostoma macrolepis]
MPGGSTKKICPFCQGILFCAQKICLNCKKEQPLKQRLKKKLQRFDEKREEWVVGHKKNHNIASIKDEAIVMLEKLHAIGYKPVLLLGKETKKKENKCEILTPRCTLSTYAQDYLQKIGSFYEYLCEGWNQDSSGNDDHLITLHLTPCDSLENTSSREEGSHQSNSPRTHERALSDYCWCTNHIKAYVGSSAVCETWSAMGTVDLTNKNKKSEGPRHMPLRKKPQKTRTRSSFSSRATRLPSW